MTFLATNHVLAVNVTDGNLNSSQDPAAPGEYITAYLTGQGQVTPAVPTGTPAPLSPLSYPFAPVHVTIGGQAAYVQFAGTAPGFVGVMQINVQVPNVPPGEQPFAITVGNTAANTTTLSVGSSP